MDAIGLIGHSGRLLSQSWGPAARALALADSATLTRRENRSFCHVPTVPRRISEGFGRVQELLITALMLEQPTVWTLEQVEAATAEMSLEQLLARYRQCVEGGHVWRRLGSEHVGADYCACCLRMRLGSGFEGWTVAPAVSD